MITHTHCPHCKKEWDEVEDLLQVCATCQYPDAELPAPQEWDDDDAEAMPNLITR